MPDNRLVWGDNLAALHALAATYEGTVDLVYIDPPFATGADFALRNGGESDGDARVAYRDRWEGGLPEYLSAMAERLVLMRRLMSERGTIFVHCDWRTSHWMRCVLDEVFGADAFKNEIVWRYRRWPAKTKTFQRMHDVLLWYGKGADDRHAFEVLYEELAPSTRATWGTKKQVADFSSGRRKPSQLEVESPGAPMSDVWDIGIIAPISHERLGYPTQKPEQLLERIVQAASKPGDLVADFFCGSGTTLAVAQRLGRRWLGCDRGRIAQHVTRKRMLAAGAAFEVVRCGPEPEAEPGPELAVRVVPDDRRRALRVGLEATAGPRGTIEHVDAWSIDWEHDGEVFVDRWSSGRMRRAKELAAQSAVHRYEQPGERTIAVRLADAFGNETRVVIPWSVP